MKIIGIGDVVVIGDDRYTVTGIESHGVTLKADGLPMRVIPLDKFADSLEDE